jgi:hypothetical protein
MRACSVPAANHATEGRARLQTRQDLARKADCAARSSASSVSARVISASGSEVQDVRSPKSEHEPGVGGGFSSSLAAESKASTCGVFATFCVYFSSATVKTAFCSLVTNDNRPGCVNDITGSLRLLRLVIAVLRLPLTVKRRLGKRWSVCPVGPSVAYGA